MAKIRSLALRDIPKLKKMISMISNLSSADVGFGYKSYVPFPFNLMNKILPLSLKFASDSYVAIEDNKLCGLVTLKPQEKNPQSWRISKLFLDENGYDVGRQLVSFAIAKLLFTFSSDGVVDNYDGSVPPMNSELSLLPAGELLGLLPVENPLKIGALAQQDDMLTVDASIFERNLTVFTEKNSNKTVFISNSIRQLFQMKEKSVIIDTSNLFEDYEKIEFGKDFKLPLNSQMIDYLFENELSEVDATTKAVIQDIFYAVQEYIKTLDFEFLPIDNFVDVVTNQYKETQMPELALLKNKLLKYRDSNVFANSKEEVFALKEKLETKNCSIIDLKNTPEVLQKEILSFIHNVLNSFDKYIYFFVPLTDNNSDKKLLKQFLNHNHIFTTILVSSSYKYASELKENAQNLIIFAPKDVNHDFASYNTFLNKLNHDEFIVWGKSTQRIPLIVELRPVEIIKNEPDELEQGSIADIKQKEESVSEAGAPDG